MENTNTVRARYWDTQRPRWLRLSRKNSAPPIRTKSSAVSNAILLENPVSAASEARLAENRSWSTPGSRPKRIWISLIRPTSATTRAHTREIQRSPPSTCSSCNNQADTPANNKPIAESGFIATGPGRMSLKAPTSSVQPMRTMQPTSMATMLEAREKVLSEVTRPGMESPPSPGRPAVSFLCPAISYSRYRLFPTPTGLLKRPHPSQDSQQPDAIVL
jgi:hypothetical protein